MDGRVVSMAVMVVCGVNEQGHRDILAVESMLDESKESYSQLFQSFCGSVKRNLYGYFCQNNQTDNARSKYQNSTENAFQKQLSSWKMDWKILYPFMPFRNLMPAKFPRSICWND
jgi:hypothetical protein